MSIVFWGVLQRLIRERQLSAMVPGELGRFCRGFGRMRLEFVFHSQRGKPPSACS
ncbi:hypothetical protein B0T21DRAFT_378666 [Apiosordaria backusii]|uniref:Uncharacterized protein n=1 Tax=Apiosordaria backusii TaxID=314023 RepID=A0AA40DGQ1_9PEZI|nr:hypothetical protein B0T21DRAFT_378666 [Apiosordaria backusii]